MVCMRPGLRWKAGTPVSQHRASRDSPLRHRSANSFCGRPDVAPNQRALGELGVARQEVLVIVRIREGQDGLGLGPQPRVALAANLILLIEGKVLQPMNDPCRVGVRIELRARRLFLLGRLDVLAARPMTSLAADRHLARALHLPVLAGGRRVGRRELETGGVATHAFRFGKTCDWKFSRIARNSRLGIVVPDPVFLLEIAGLPPSGRISGRRVGIYGPADRQNPCRI
jgi:hypothetical protein